MAGSTLYLPVEVQGGLLSLGDAAQGDGEPSGSAIECPLEHVALRVVLRADLSMAWPRTHTPAGLVTFGFDENLDVALAAALNDMFDLVMADYGLTRKLALALVSVVADVRLTRLVNGVRGAHVMLPRDAMSA